VGVSNNASFAIDSNGCRFDLNVRVYESIRASVSSVQDVVCYGSNAGGVVLSSVGGSGNYRYRIIQRGSISAWQTSPAFVGLPAGTYNFLIEDAGDEAYSAIVSDVVIQQPSTPFIVAVARKTRSSNASPTATLLAVSAGAQGSVQFRLDTGPWVSAGSFSNVAAGPHNVSARDSAGCISQTSDAIYSIPTVSVAPSAVTCADRADGSALINLDGGLPPYTLSLPDLGRSQSTYLFANLSAGEWNLVVVDSVGDGNMFSFSISIPEANPIAAYLRTLRRAEQVSVSISGGSGGPYRVDPLSITGITGNIYGGNILDSVQMSPRNLRVYDSLECPHDISVQAVSYFSPSIVDTVSSCNGSGPTQVLFKMLTAGGLPPYSHLVGGTYYADGEWIPAPPEWMGASGYSFPSYDNFDRNPRYTRVNFDGIPAPLTVQTVETLPTTGASQSDGYVHFSVSPYFVRTPVSISFIKGGSEVANLLTSTLDVQYRLSAGNYTVSLNAMGCIKSFNFSISDPPAPVINRFNCFIDAPAALITCSWIPNLDERYSIQMATSSLNDTTVPDPEAFAEVFPRGYGTQASFGYIPGEAYYLKLIADGPGGASEAVWRGEASFARPTLPTQVRASVNAEANIVTISWNPPQNLLSTTILYDVYAWFYGSVLQLGADVSELSVSVNSSALNNWNLGPGTTFYYLIIAKLPEYDYLSSKFPVLPSELESPPYVLLRTPVVPVPELRIDQAAFISPVDINVGRCDVRCAFIKLALDGSNVGGVVGNSYPVRMTVQIGNSQSQQDPTILFDGDVQVYGVTRANVFLPQYPFGYFATVRVTLRNAAGSSYIEKQIELSEVPSRPAVYASASSAGDQAYTRVTASCVEQYLAVGVQASMFRYEWVYSSSRTTADWSQSASSAELTGSFFADLVSNGTWLHMRCFARNSAGESANWNGDATVFMPSPLTPPTNLRIDAPYWFGNRIRVILSWDVPSSQGSQIFSDLRIVGSDCSASVSEIYSVSDSRYYLTSLPRCNVGFSARFRDGRGPTDWTDTVNQLVNLPPNDPEDVLLRGSVAEYQSSVLSIVVQARAQSVSLQERSVLYGSLEFTSNDTDTQNGASWKSISRPQLQDFAKDISHFAPYNNGRIGPTTAVNLTVQPYPVEYTFRALFNNGLDSNYVINKFVVLGVPANLVVSPSLTFHPTNASLVFTWNAAQISNVTYPYSVSFNTSGSIRVVSGVALNASVAFYGLAAGTTARFSVQGCTRLRCSEIATADSLIASGDYWPFNTSALRPNITRITPMRVRLTWKADNTPHGFSTTTYTVAMSTGAGMPLERIQNIDVYTIVNNSISWEFGTDVERQAATFAIVPRNPLGSGPMSDASEPSDFRRSRHSTRLLNPSVGQTFAFNETVTAVEIKWQPAPFVLGYRVTVYQADVPGAPRMVFNNVSCCSILINVTKLQRYSVEMAFYDPLWDWLFDSQFYTDLILGIPDGVQLDSVVPQGVNQTGAYFVVSWTLPRGSLITQAGGAVSSAIRISSAGLESWTESFVDPFSCVAGQRYSFNWLSCQSQVWLTASAGSKWDVQAAAVSVYGRGAWSGTRSVPIANLPVAVSGWLDETDAAIRDPKATETSAILIPLRWSNQHPFGGDVTEYRVRLWTICAVQQYYCHPWQYSIPNLLRLSSVPNPAGILCELTSDAAPCDWNPYYDNQFMPTDSQVANSSALEWWLPITFGVETRVVLYGRNVAGWAVVYDRIHLANPRMSVSNLQATVVRRSLSWYYDIDVYLEWETTFSGSPYQSYDLLWAQQNQVVAQVISVWPVRSYNTLPLGGGCNRIPGRPAFARCGNWVTMRNPTNVATVTSFVFRRFIYNPTSVYLNSSITPDVTLQFPNMWQSVSRNNWVAFPGQLISFECSRFPEYELVAPTGPNGERLLWRYFRIGTTSTPGSRGVVDVSFRVTWRDGSLPPKRRTAQFSYAPFYKDSHYGGPYIQDRGVNELTRSRDIAWLDDGGIVDIDEVVVTESTGFSGLSFNYTGFTAACPSYASPRAPVRLVMGQPVTRDGMAEISAVVTVDGFTGALTYNNLVLYSTKWNWYPAAGGPTGQLSDFGQNWVSVTDSVFDSSNKTYSFKTRVPLDNYLSFTVALQNNAGWVSYPTADPVAPVWASSPRSISSSVPTGKFFSTQGNIGLGIVWDIPLPSSLVASTKALLKIDDTIYPLPANNISVLRVPSLPVGVHTLSVSLDSRYWGPTTPFEVLPLPLTPNVSGPTYIDIRRPQQYVTTLRSPNFKSIVRVLCDWEGILVPALFSPDREAVVCPNPALTSVVPRFITLRLSLDGTNTSVLHSVFFWGTLVLSYWICSFETYSFSLSQIRAWSQSLKSTRTLTILRSMRPSVAIVGPHRCSLLR
jgi:hypothetical protein